MPLDSVSPIDEEIENLVSSVTKYRRAAPRQWLELRSQATSHEVERLANTTVKGSSKNAFKLAPKDIKKLSVPKISVNDLKMFENRLLKYNAKLREIMEYLERRVEYLNNSYEIGDAEE